MSTLPSRAPAHVSSLFGNSCQSASLRFISTNDLRYSSPAAGAPRPKLRIWGWHLSQALRHSAGPPAEWQRARCSSFRHQLSPNKLQPSLICHHLLEFSWQKQNCASELCARSVLGSFLSDQFVLVSVSREVTIKSTVGLALGFQPQSLSRPGSPGLRR